MRDNLIRIDVANTAVNYLAGAGFPNYDYQKLWRGLGIGLSRRRHRNLCR